MTWWKETLSIPVVGMQTVGTTVMENSRERFQQTQIDLCDPTRLILGNIHIKSWSIYQGEVCVPVFHFSPTLDDSYCIVVYKRILSFEPIWIAWKILHYLKQARHKRHILLSPLCILYKNSEYYIIMEIKSQATNGYHLTPIEWLLS